MKTVAYWYLCLVRLPFCWAMKPALEDLSLEEVNVFRGLATYSHQQQLVQLQWNFGLLTSVMLKSLLSRLSQDLEPHQYANAYPDEWQRHHQSTI